MFEFKLVFRSNKQSPNVKSWEKVKWKDIKVSDIVKVASDEHFPCDLLFLSSRFVFVLFFFSNHSSMEKYIYWLLGPVKRTPFVLLKRPTWTGKQTWKLNKWVEIWLLSFICAV
jgi:hypothetical protein